MEALECGAACLAMIAAYYGLWLPLEQVRRDCGVSRDGANAMNLLKAARNYGFTAKGFRYEPEVLRAKGKFPCVIHWDFNHFVVLKGFRGKRAYLNDPARGALSVDMEEFDRSFTGVCLMLEPSEAFVPGGSRKSVLAFARERLRGTGPAFALLLMTAGISALCSLISPGFSRVLMDRLLTGKNPEWLYAFAAGLFALAAVQVIAGAVKAAALLKVQGKFAVSASAKYMWHVLRLPMEFFSQRLAGDIAARQKVNADIASSLISTLAPLAIDLAMLVFYLAVMFRYSVPLAAIGLLSMLLSALANRYISDRRVNVSRVLSRNMGEKYSVTISGIELIETIKSSGAEEGFFEKWAGYQAAANDEMVRFLDLNAYLKILPAALSAACNLLILGAGVYLTMQGQFTVGMLLAFQGFMNAVNAPAEKLMGAGQALQEMRTNMERVEDVMRYPADRGRETQDIPDEEDASGKLTGALELKDITFGYSRLAPPLICSFSLKLEPGKSVAFVGGSGSGKSTLSKLISGLYKPWSGEILYDGTPLDSVNRAVLTGSLAVVDQDIVLFEDTVANNIKMWDDTIEDFEMILAARDAQIHDVIMQRDNNYQYRMLEGGKDFSGGQRQRLEIARVLAQDPTIVILDEATSALDAKTEYNVIRSIRDRGITMIVIAHRLSTVRDCDEIIVFDRGSVVERGTHEELMARGGKYTQLVHSE